MSRKPYWRVVVAGVTALALFGAACGDDDDDATTASTDQPAATGDASGGENVLEVGMQDYLFSLEGELEAGAISLAMRNEGEELHETAMARLQDGKTLDDVRAALEEAGGEDGDGGDESTETTAMDDPATTAGEGGEEEGEEGEEPDPLDGLIEEDSRIDDLGAVLAPGTALTVGGSDIPAGEYVLLCYVPNAAGTPHFQLGMLNSFTIAEGETEAPSDATATYTATDESVEGPAELPAGTATLAMVNDSATNREVQILKIEEGKTPEDVATFFMEAESGDGPPDFAAAPLDFFAFVFDAEQDRTIEVELTPGQWAIGMPDPDAPFEGPPTEDPHLVLVTVT
jgi:hypothetical protein